MPTRKSQAEWRGDLMKGDGSVKLGTGAFEGKYSFASRFEDGTGTNPEELIAAAHAACYSMALAGSLGAAGFEPQKVDTTSNVTVEKVGDGFAITKIALQTEAVVPGIDDATFQQHAEATKTGCPVSKALSAVPMTLTAKLVNP